MNISGPRPTQSGVLCTWSQIAVKALILVNLCQVILQVHGTADIQPRN
jgi:hypothetical protein